MLAMNRHSMILGLAVLLGMTACGHAARSSEPAATPATLAAATTAVADTATTATAAVGSVYATKAFNLPFDVTIPGWLDATPSLEQPNFVTWQSPTVDRAVRFLIPVDVYPPGGTGPIPPPHDYLDYLLAQTDHGAHFADQTQTTVDGKPATIVTATVDNSLDGSLGCPDTVTSAHDCFGLQPEFVLRIAVDRHRDHTPARLATRARRHRHDHRPRIVRRTAHHHPIQRPARASAATTTAVGVATALDGTYRWTITAADAMEHGMPNDKTPESQATFPWIFTVTMYDGHWTMKHRQADGDFEDGEGTYTLDGDRLVVDIGGGISTTQTVIVDGDGTLHLTAQGATDPGGVFVTTTKPWTKVAGGTDTTATVLDGAYRWTLTAADAMAYGLPNDKTPQSQATFPWVFTMTMDAGAWRLANIDGQGVANEDAGHGSYTVEGDHVVFREADEVFDYTFSVDADGTVHLVAQPPISPGTAWVMATNPWTKTD